MATKGTASTITFGTTGFAPELLDVGGPGVTRESLDTTHMGTTNARTFVEASLYDAGEVSLTFQYDVGDSPPIDQPTEVITIAFAGAGSVSFNGFMTNFSPSAAIDEIMTATATIKAADEVTW